MPEVSFGDFSVEGIGGSPCVDGSFLQGDLRLQGDGFAAGAQVRLQLWAAELLFPLGSATADGAGAIDVLIAIPEGVSKPDVVLFEADGQAPSGLRNLATMVGVAPAVPADGDGDGIPDFCDNCPSIPNASQDDDDADQVGNACDSCPMDMMNDSDGDGQCKDVDSCPYDASNDVDGDSVCGDIDNCPTIANPAQKDSDANGIGDACQTNPTCSDGVDNDDDGLIDFPSDRGCVDASDSSEQSASLPCDDGVDNDHDAKADFRVDGLGDPGCFSTVWFSESPKCSDHIDNDGDGFVDFDGHFGLHAPDPDCYGAAYWITEVPEPDVFLGLGAGISWLATVGRRRMKL